MNGRYWSQAAADNVYQLPVIHLDQLYWEPGWLPTPAELFAERVESIVSEECWIVDGNYSATICPRLERADLAIFLDLPRRICFLRVLTRMAKSWGKVRNDGPDGCPERLDLNFLWWVWTWFGNHRDQMIERLSELDPAVNVVWLRSPRDVDTWVSREFGKLQGGEEGVERR